MDVDAVPDYADIIKEPMDFETMTKRIEGFEYIDLDSFHRDLELIVDNAILYNRPNTVYARQALKIKQEIPLIIGRARDSLRTVGLENGCDGILKSFNISNIFKYPSMEIIEKMPLKTKSTKSYAKKKGR